MCQIVVFNRRVYTQNRKKHQAYLSVFSKETILKALLQDERTIYMSNTKKKAIKSVRKVAAGTVPQHITAFKNLVIVTDFGCGIANAQVEMRFRNVMQWVQEEVVERNTMPEEITLPELPKDNLPNIPSVMHVMDIPFGNTDYCAYSLYTCYRTLGRSRPNLFIHACDPGVGSGENRSILVNDYGNVFVGPDNTSLGLLKAYFDERGIPSKLWRIDLEKIEELEQYRMQEPSYHIPLTFHGRDVFAVVAGLLAGGVKPEDLASKEVKKGPVLGDYADGITPMPQRLGEKINCFAFRDNTYGNLKTNLTLDALTYDQLVEEEAIFKVTYKISKPKFWQFKTRSLMFVTKRIFSDVKNGEPILYLGSTFAPEWDERFVEVAVAMDNVAMKLGLPRSYVTSVPLTIERVR